MLPRLAFLIVVLVAALCVSNCRAADDDQLLREARQALARGNPQQATLLASRVIEANPRHVDAYLLRAEAHVAAKRPQDAVADYDQVLQRKPDAVEVYNSRGSARFQSGDVAGSIDDFDRYIELRPQREKGHWKRGISYYYAGQYDKGRRQFEAYQTFDDNDVENAVWRYLCMAPSAGADQARQALLKIKDDRRVPMMQVYALFAGRATPAEVLDATRVDDPTPEQLHSRLFYANLYVGLYHEAAGDADLARQHITRAADDYPIGHYMWDVAHVHAARLKRGHP